MWKRIKVTDIPSFRLCDLVLDDMNITVHIHDSWQPKTYLTVKTSTTMSKDEVIVFKGKRPLNTVTQCLAQMTPDEILSWCMHCEDRARKAGREDLQEDIKRLLGCS